MPKPLDLLRAPETSTTETRGPWLVLIGDSGETSAEDIEAFFAEIWPELGPEATLQ